MAWPLMISVLTVNVAVSSFETIQQIWDTETFEVITHGHLQDNAVRNILVASSIECVLAAFNLSIASYDESSQRCVLYDTIDKTADTKRDNLLYIHEITGSNNTRHEITGSNNTRYEITGSNNTRYEMTGSNNTRHEITGDIKTCGDVGQASLSGVYRITPVPGRSFDVYCDMDSEGGPWTAIQNRQSNEVDFFRKWDEYKTGFGNLLGNFWLGNEQIHALTETPGILRIQLQSLNGTFGYAEYSQFQVSNETNHYKLTVNGFSGNISNALEWNNGQLFSTPDRENDILDRTSCAEIRKSSWWHRKCTDVNINGLYDPSHWRESMYWQGFYGENTKVQMKKTKMLLKKP
ncbi:angiopoietin-related protein 7-like isoform X2 [Pecten maximus]|uniref:angiopoietin-related protein 7-like isoform X2 n=1 Tax=Pecten maximus TaxID=6579 RepID=UPI0014581348|nr:angiopoietin-related protein 7-like isoform X2 [Pecten maximus]